MMCTKCKKMTGAMFLLVGIIYLLGDLSIWNFFGINWWTALFAAWGIMYLASGSCKDCNSSCDCGCSEPMKMSKK